MRVLIPLSFIHVGVSFLLGSYDAKAQFGLKTHEIPHGCQLGQWIWNHMSVPSDSWPCFSKNMGTGNGIVRVEGSARFQPSRSSRFPPPFPIDSRLGRSTSMLAERGRCRELIWGFLLDILRYMWSSWEGRSGVIAEQLIEFPDRKAPWPLLLMRQL